MKKLFGIISVFALTFCAVIGGTKEPNYCYAETETSQNIASSSETTSEQETSEQEQEPLVLDNETFDSVSQTAKDVIQVIKTILNQPIVIGGVSVTLGAVIAWLFGKFITKILDNRSNKFDNKIKGVLQKVGFTEEQIAKLFENYELLLQVLQELVENNKNVNVREKCLAMLNGTNQEIEKVENDIIETASEIVENDSNTRQEKIKELLEK